MTEARVIRSLGVEAPGHPYVFAYDEAPPAEGELLLSTMFSGFSAGTELTFFKNTNPYLRSHWNDRLGVFEPGPAATQFPVPFLGYMEVGRIVHSNLPGFAIGDRLAETWGHKSGHAADPSRDVLIPLSPTLDPILGIFVGQMGPIAANGILHADAELCGAGVSRLGQGIAGRPVLVIGAGVVGLLTALFARHLGAAEVLIADPSEFRRNRAEALGFQALPEEESWRRARMLWHNGGGDRGADIVFQTRARPESLATALRALRPQGTVIDLAFYQTGADSVRLGEEFHHNGLGLRCAQINRVPRGLGAVWDRRRLARETVALLASEGEAIAREVITHVVPIEDAAGFLRSLIADRPDFIQIVFEYS